MNPRQTPFRSGPLHLHIGHHFWGAGNIGDDWMLAGFLSAVQLRGLEFRITCCTQHDIESMRLRFPQIEWYGMDVNGREALIANADVWVGLGDTPFQSHAGTWLLDHIEADLAICRRFGTPVYFLAVGAEGPEACRLPQTSRILQQAWRVWTRDPLSAKLLGEVPGGRTPIIEAADLAHLYFDSLPAPENVPFLGNAGLVVNVERTEQLDIAELSKFILAHQGPPIRWIAQEVRNLQVSEVCLWEQFDSGVKARLIPSIPDYQRGSLESLLAPYAGLQAMLSTRYHSTLAAAWRGIAVSVYARSQKLDGVVNQLGCATCESLTSAAKIAEGLAKAKPVKPSVLREAARSAQAACDDFFEEISSARSARHILSAKPAVSPAQSLEQKQPERILWVRTDSIGDAVLASSMIEPLRKKFPRATLAVLCQMHVAELFTACPLVDSIICYDRKKMDIPAEREQIISEIAAFRPDVILNSVRSRDKLSDELTLALGEAQHIAIEGDLDNISEADRDTARIRYEHLIASPEGHQSELQRHADFLRGLGIEARELQPVVWTSPEDEALAGTFFQREQLDPGRTLALAPFTQHAIKDYPAFAAALQGFTGWNILLLGGAETRAGCELLAGQLAGNVVNLAGCTTLREMAAIIRRCKILIGSDSCAAHIACAVGIPNVVVMGGGHFGRFFPGSPLTTMVALPMHCYGCIWHCKYTSAHCIQSLKPEVLAQAITAALQVPSIKPRVFVQVAQGGLAALRPGLDAWLSPNEVELIPVQLEQSTANFWPIIQYGRGVHQAEAGFRWLDTEAEVEVLIPADGCSASMTFDLQAARMSLYPLAPLMVGIMVNEQLNQVVFFQTDNQIEAVQLNLPPSAQPYRLSFNSNQFFMGAGDPRCLAVQLQKVVLTRGKDDCPSSPPALSPKLLVPSIHIPASPTPNQSYAQ